MMLRDPEEPALPVSELQVFFACPVCDSSKAKITFWENLMGGKSPSLVAVVPSRVFELVEAVVSPPKEIILLSEETGEHHKCTTVISDYSFLPHLGLTDCLKLLKPKVLGLLPTGQGAWQLSWPKHIGCNCSLLLIFSLDVFSGLIVPSGPCGWYRTAFFSAVCLLESL